MDQGGFATYLQERKLTDEQIAASITIAEAFEEYLRMKEHKAAAMEATADDVNRFSMQMIDREQNTWDNYVALLRFGRFIGSTAVHVAALELIDGAEAMENLHTKLGEAIGPKARDEVFAGVELPPLGTLNVDKPAITQVVMERMEASVDAETCVKVLGSGLRYLEDDWYLDAKRMYEEAGGIDEYLERKGNEFIAEMKKHRNEGTLYFTQPITDEVIDYVERHPEIRAGVRVGNRIIEAKPPHEAREFLASKNPRDRAYHYCHCPWVKESLRNGPSRISPAFCNCSAAFHKKPYEVIFGRSLKAEVLETVLAGDPWCKFAIHLPAGVAPEDSS